MDIAEIRRQFPQYSDMSDGDLAAALHKKYYSDMPQDDFAAKIGMTTAKQAPEAPQRTTGQEAAREVGLTARYGLEGPLSLFNSVIGDPVNTAINYGIRGVNAVTGKDLPQLDLPSRATKRAYDQSFPSPETPTENVVGAISKGLSGGGLMTSGAQALPRAMQALPAIRAIVAAPGADLIAQAAGAGGSETAKQLGGGTVAQLLAGAITPMGISGAANVAGRVTGGLNDLRRPLTQGGAEQIAGDVLGRIAQNKDAAVRNLARYNGLVKNGDQVGSPGFQPTAGAVSGDYGLVGGQQVISRGDASPQFAQRFAANNEAHAADLGRLNATDEAITAYTQKRDDITKPLRDKAFAPVEVTPGYSVQRHVDFTPVAEQIGTAAASAAGGKAESQKALKWVAERIEKYAQESRTDPENAYALYQDIGDLVAGKIKDENGAALRLAGGLANDVKKTLGQQIELAAPGFKNYLEHYSRLSKPIDRLQIIRDKLGGQDLSKVTNAMPVVTDNGATFAVSQDKVRRAVQGINDETSLAPRQRDILNRVSGDLNAETFAARGGKQPGSDTYQNMASANFVNRMLGDTLGSSGFGKAVQAPLNFLNRPFESRINDLIVKAYQDPKLMEELLRKARTARGSPTLAGLLNDSAQLGNAGLLGSLYAR